MRAILLATLLLVTPALAQQGALQPVDPSVQSATPETARPAPTPPGQPAQAPGVAAGDTSVQSAAPEVGAGRGEAGPDASGANTTQPENAEQPHPTSPRPAEPQAAAPHAPSPPQVEIPTGPPMAARGGNVADEAELEHILRGGVIEGRVSIPNQAAGILIQPDGRDWRQFRMRWLTIAGVVALFGTVLALGLFYALRGRTRITAGRAGRRIHRYGLVERVNHWMVATSFILLALTGLNITYGVFVLRPLIGPEAFTALTLGAQAVHHYVGFAFLLGILVMLVLWARQNLVSRVDIAWLRAGGPLAKGHAPAGKFNAGQKLLYWFTMLAGLAMTATGLLLMMPGLLDNVILSQWTHMAHGLIGVGMIAVILGHIYIGSLGMEGAFEAMRDGQVDYNWAREHHSAWLEEEVERARISVANDFAAPRRAAGAD
jgi:formate dehydrogenase subunit gamma